MNTRIAAVLASLVGLAACQSEGPLRAEAATDTQGVDRDWTPGQDWRFPDSPEKLPGMWSEKNGVLECNGYLTRNESQNYCAPEVPGDWSPFKFQGETYYVQPLSAQVDSESRPVQAPSNESLHRPPAAFGTGLASAATPAPAAGAGEPGR